MATGIFTIAAIGEEAIGIGDCAEFGDLDLFGQDAEIEELPAADLPKIKVSGFDLVRPVDLGDFFFIVDEFSSLGAQAWRDTDEEIFGIASVVGF